MQGYLPTQLYDLNSSYGDAASLTALNAALLSSDLRPVADIVINHRCADEKDSKGRWNNFRDDVPHPGHRIDWGPWAITGNDPDFGGGGAADTGDDYGPSPDIDHTNPKVQAGIVDWLRWLKVTVGFEGWRLDFAKGYAAEFAKFYIQETLDPGQAFCIGEVWADAAWSDGGMDYDQDGMRQQLVDWADGAQYSAVFDFTTKAQLQEAVKHGQYDRLQDGRGKPSGVMGWWPARAVTFTDNHDTGSTQQHWPFPAEHMLLGYAYILTHPGIPSILWEHVFDDGLGKGVKELVALRKRAGVHAESKIEILAAEPDLYVARIGGSLVCKLGPRHDMGALLPAAAEGWALAASGKDWAVWELTAKEGAAP